MTEVRPILLFTDGSVNTKLKYGFGATLALSDLEVPDSELKQKIRIQRFDETSSTKLELQTVIWILNEFKSQKGKIILYTDSQNIIGLPSRRERLEKNNYFSKQNKRIKNWELYQKFYSLIDLLDIEILKVKGHSKSKDKNRIEKIFSLVDKASRKALREENAN